MSFYAAAALLVTALLVFVIGMAIQRGNTCTVVAVDDIVHRGSWQRFMAIVSAWFWVAGGLTLLSLTTGLDPGAKLFRLPCGRRWGARSSGRGP